jgi:hypothetical protein
MKWLIQHKLPSRENSSFISLIVLGGLARDIRKADTSFLYALLARAPKASRDYHHLESKFLIFH